jgi:hypothetical protein
LEPPDQVKVVALPLDERTEEPPLQIYAGFGVIVNVGLGEVRII